MARINSLDEVQGFINRATFEDDLEDLNKDSLLLICSYLDLGLTIHTRKSEMIRQIVKKTKSPDAVSADSHNSLEKIQLEIKLRELALGEKRISAEFKRQR